MLDLLKPVTEWVAVGVELAAVLVIAGAALAAAGSCVLVAVRDRGKIESGIEEVRLRLARWLAVALEFALAADILRTAVAPSWDDIGKLAAIAALRTLLNFFLQREIANAARNEVPH